MITVLFACVHNAGRSQIAAEVQWLITMGCGDECPVVPGTHRDDWPIPDPRGQPIDRVRAIADEIDGRVGRLIDAQHWRRRE